MNLSKMMNTQSFAATSQVARPAQFSPTSSSGASAPGSSMPSQSYGQMSQAQSMLSAYSAGPTCGGDSTSQLADQQVGYGHYVGEHIEKMDARAEKLLDSGKISDSQYEQITQIDSSVSQQLLQDDASDNGKKLSQADFTTARAALTDARSLMAA